jgi:NADPH-dependent glutamate synthase beta subunit-like oxidoreductase
VAVLSEAGYVEYCTAYLSIQYGSSLSELRGRVCMHGACKCTYVDKCICAAELPVLLTHVVEFVADLLVATTKICHVHVS